MDFSGDYPIHHRIIGRVYFKTHGKTGFFYSSIGNNFGCYRICEFCFSICLGDSDESSADNNRDGRRFKECLTILFNNVLDWVSAGIMEGVNETSNLLTHTIEDGVPVCGKKGFKVTPIYFIPVLGSLLISSFLSFLVFLSNVKLLLPTVLLDGDFGLAVNTTFFLILAGVGISMIYIFLRFSKTVLIRWIVGLVITTVAFMLSTLYSELFFFILNIAEAWFLILFLAVVLTLVVDVEIFRSKGVFNKFVILTLWSTIGAFLGASIPPFNSVLILFFLAGYETVMVYRSSLGKTDALGIDHLPGLNFTFMEIKMGLGDLTLYSMLTAHVFLNVGLMEVVGAVVGIVIGFFFALKTLEKKGIFLRLLLPILLGLTLTYAVHFIS